MIDYESLAQDAMRGVVRTVLARTAKGGLPGDHHFYVSFDTQAPGVGLSKRLKEKYPEEMTIVLQHRFWDLTVSEDRFEVKLTFDGIPERLVVPFAALKVFFDPSVRYGLQFEAPDFGPDAISHPQAGRTEPASAGSQQFRSAARAAGERKPSRPRKPRADRAGEPIAAAEAAMPRASSGRPAQSSEPKPREPAPDPVAAVTSEPAAPSAEIVRLDAFRKK